MLTLPVTDLLKPLFQLNENDYILDLLFGVRKIITMNSAVIDKFQATQMKDKVADVRPGETVKVHYKIREGGKERIQIFEGLVIGTKATKSFQGSFTVRKVVDGIGVERTFPLHSPWVTKVERVKSGKVRRAKLNFVRGYALSRRFKLKDKGVEGTIWEEIKAEKEAVAEEQERHEEGIVEESVIAETLETSQDKPDELSGESVGSESGELGDGVSRTEEVPDPEKKLPN